MAITITAGAGVRRSVAVLAAAGLTFGLAACGGSGSADDKTTSAGSDTDASAEGSTGEGELTGEITFQTWSLTPKFTDYLNGVMKAFEDAHPGVTVKLMDQPGDGYDDKVLTQASTGTLPDVVNLPPDFALPLAQAGKLLNLAEADTTMDEVYVAGGIGAYEFAGLDGVWGYPWYLQTDVDYWNTKLFSECGLDPESFPTTLDELFAQATTYSENCKDSWLLSRSPGLGDFTQAGIPLLSEDGETVAFNTPEGAAMLQKYVDAYKDGLMPGSVLSGATDGNAALFLQSQAAWTTGGASAYANFIQDSPSLDGNIGASHAIGIPPLYVQGVSVSAESKNPETAQAFAAFVTNAENQNAFAREVAVFPSTLASEDDPFFTDDDGTMESKVRVIAFESLKDAQVLVPPQLSPAMADILGQQIGLAFRGDVTPQEALDKAASQIDKMLADQR